MDMFYRIKCINNGKYVSKTTMGTWISYTKKGKIWTSENLALKNLQYCLDFSKRAELLEDNRYRDLKFELEIIK